jgi:hypothetical protein
MRKIFIILIGLVWFWGLWSSSQRPILSFTGTISGDWAVREPNLGSGLESGHFAF